MLRLINICKSYKCGKSREVILDNVNINFKKNELVFILGSSGSGKSTLLNVIGGLLEVDSGKIMLDDRDITKFNNNMLCNYRNNMVGFIFQNYHLVEYMSVIDNIKLGMTICDNNNSVDSILKSLGIYNKKKMLVSKLSGGEKQRVAIARAIINNPDIILADEPTGAMDSSNSMIIMNILKKISKDKLVIVVSHDNNLANKFADRIINISDGAVDCQLLEADCEKFGVIKKKKIRLLSIIKLAIKNLFLKFGRTLFTSLAISLGFISILMVLCLSKSFNDDIKDLEKDIVSIFPISIYNGDFEIENNDLNINKSDKKIILKNKNDYIHENKINRNYLDYVNKIDEISYINYDYDISMPVISDRYNYLDNKYMKMLSNNDFINNNYNILYGNNISSMYDILLKVDSNNNVDSDLLKVFNIDNDIEYEDLVGRKLRIIINDLYYVKNGEYYFVNTDTIDMYNGSNIELEIVGIVSEKEIVDDNSYFYYSSDLIDYVMDENSKSMIVMEQLDKDYNVLGINTSRWELLSYLGYDSLPRGINVYVSNLDNKDIVLNKLDSYNSSNDKLIYVDTMNDAINILRNIINIITVILVIFSIISILVGSLMIFILTNNRVIERVKEIGILRGIGARRRDIVRLFNIENLIIGIISSIIGIIFINLMKEPVNNLFYMLFDDRDLFVIYYDLVIICIIFNIFIVILSGYIPSKMASNKNIIECINNGI